MSTKEKVFQKLSYTFYQSKKRAPYIRSSFFACLFSETIAAINGTVVVRLKRNLAGFSASCTNSIKHLSCASVCISLARCAARSATLRLIGKAFFSKKLLLTCCEGEFLSAIFADNSLVGVH